MDVHRLGEQTMKKALIPLLTVILMALSSMATYLYFAEKITILRTAPLMLLSGKILVVEVSHLDEINRVKTFNDLMESTIKNKINMIDAISELGNTFSVKNTTAIDKSFLHLRLGIFHRNNGNEDMANAEFETALNLYNSTKNQPVALEQMMYIYSLQNQS